MRTCRNTPIATTHQQANTTPNLWLSEALCFLTLVATALFCSSTESFSAEGATKEEAAWPCIQRKVVELSPATMWDGPPIQDINDWYKDEPTRKLIPFLVSRRIEMSEVEKAIEDFAKTHSEDKRDRALTVLFAGVFDNTNTARRRIIRGIERYQSRQDARAKALEAQSTALSDLRRNAGKSEDANKKAEEAEKKYDWDARVFQERQQNVTLACEIPVLIEQRAYALAQAIRAQMIN